MTGIYCGVWLIFCGFGSTGGWDSPVGPFEDGGGGIGFVPPVIN